MTYIFNVAKYDVLPKYQVIGMKNTFGIDKIDFPPIGE